MEIIWSEYHDLPDRSNRKLCWLEITETLLVNGAVLRAVKYWSSSKATGADFPIEIGG